jgi:hypothetical protein
MGAVPNKNTKEVFLFKPSMDIVPVVADRGNSLIGG